MIFLAVLFASVTVLGVGIILGWAIRAGIEADVYRQGYEDALKAVAWLNYEDANG